MTKKYILIAGVNGAGKSTQESFHNLKQVMEFIDLLVFYDNTERFRRFAFYRKGRPIKLSKNIPQWFLGNIYGTGQ